jgi:putative glycosyltransferase (TIGR04372 family)
MIDFKKVKNLFKKNKFLFFKKLTLKSFKIIISLPFFPFSLGIFIFINIFKPILHIRVSPLPTTRIGHFAQNVDLYLSHKKYIQKKKTLDIFFLENFISNYYLLKIWKTKIIIINLLIIKQIYLLNELLKISSNKIKTIESDRDTNNIYSNSKIKNENITFSSQEKILGYKILEKLGIAKQEKIVCFVDRNSYYLDSQHPDTDWSYHNYRNTNIDNFLPTAEMLTKKGYYVIRMGRHNKKKLFTQNKKIIDYSFSIYKSEFMDIFIPHLCEFYISVGTGPDAFAKIFRKPIVYVNHAPIGDLNTYREDSLFLCKRHYSTNLSRNLTLREIFEHGVGLCWNSKIFKKKKILLIENTPQEIYDVVLEMCNIIKDKKSLKRNKDNIKFWKIYEKYLIKYNIRYHHGNLLGKYSASFIKNNPLFLK